VEPESSSVGLRALFAKALTLAPAERERFFDQERLSPDARNESDGVAYLAMEFVDGLPLDRYSELHTLSVEQKLRLFLPLCDAVDYAHQKLIIHRDLKPSNVLVTAAGIPKLLDFGIARSLETRHPLLAQRRSEPFLRLNRGRYNIVKACLAPNGGKQARSFD
jgi:serine/threonine protein kinase